MEDKDKNNPDEILTEPLLRYAAASIMKQDIEEFDKGLEVYKTVTFNEKALHDRLLPLFDDLEKKQNKAKRRQATKRICRIAAGFLFATLLTGTILYNTADAFRVAVLNIVFSVEEKFTSFSLNEEDPSPQIDINSVEFPLQLTYIPEGFVLAADSSNTSLYYENDIGQVFNLTFITKDGVANVDSENAIVKDIELNNKEIKLFIKKDRIIAVWQEKNLLFIAKSNLDEKTFLDIIVEIK